MKISLAIALVHGALRISFELFGAGSAYLISRDTGGTNEQVEMSVYVDGPAHAAKTLPIDGSKIFWVEFEPAL